MASDNNQETDYKTSQKFGKPVFSLKRTQEAARKNIQISATLSGNLGAAIEA